MNVNLVMGVKRGACGLIAGMVISGVLWELLTAIAVALGVLSTAAFAESVYTSAVVGSTIGLATWIYGRLSWRLIGIISGAYAMICVLWWIYVLHLNTTSGASIIWGLLTTAAIEIPLFAVLTGLTAYLCFLTYDKLDRPFAPVDVKKTRTNRPKRTYGEDRPRINL